MSDDVEVPKHQIKIPQPHGGAINAGGTPGNRGGGRTPSALRAAAREELEPLIPILGNIAKGKARNADKIRAIGVIATIGLDRSMSIEDVRAALKATTEEIREFLPRDQAEALIAKIRPHWLAL